MVSDTAPDKLRLRLRLLQCLANVMCCALCPSTLELRVVHIYCMHVAVMPVAVGAPNTLISITPSFLHLNTNLFYILLHCMQVGLVPTAMGGTNLYQHWAPGGQLWSNMVARTQAAVQQLGGQGRLRGMIWIQVKKRLCRPKRLPQVLAGLHNPSLSPRSFSVITPTSEGAS
jgi:hypothetical protein